MIYLHRHLAKGGIQKISTLWDAQYHKSWGKGGLTPSCNGTSLVAPWLRLCLPMQGLWIRSLVREPRSQMPQDVAKNLNKEAIMIKQSITSRMLLKVLIIASYGEDTEQLGSSCLVSENATSFSYSGKHFGNLL